MGVIYYRHYSYLYRKIILPNGIMQHLVFGFLFPYVYGPLAYRLQFAVSFGAYANATQVVSVLHFSQHLDNVFLVDWLVWFLKSYLQFKLQRQYPSKNSSSSNPKMSFCISSNVRRQKLIVYQSGILYLHILHILCYLCKSRDIGSRACYLGSPHHQYTL